MRLQKRTQIEGEWLKAKQLSNGMTIRLTDAAFTHPSQYVNDNGSPKMQVVAHCSVFSAEGVEAKTKSPLIVRINAPSVEGLIEAFGEETAEWINEPLTVQLEKTTVGGKRSTALYLIPEGFELTEDASDYMHVTRIGETPVAAAPPDEALTF